MQVVELGNAFDGIFAALGDNVLTAIVYDMAASHVYGPRDVHEVYDPTANVYLMSDYHSVAGDRHAWKLGRLNSDPIIVTGTIPEDSTHILGSDALPHTAVEIEKDGHIFDPLDMMWVCVCENEMEPDAKFCGECHAANPFLGLIV